MLVARVDPSRAAFTLIEVLAVVSLLAILLAVALPRDEGTRPAKTELAASRVADALRFARGEALRTGDAYGVVAEPSLGRARVFRADTATNPATPIFDVLHPVSHRPYEVDLGSARPPVDLAASETWVAPCSSPGSVLFDGSTTPRCLDPLGVLLAGATYTLSLSGHTSLVQLDGETGRVVGP